MFVYQLFCGSGDVQLSAAQTGARTSLQNHTGPQSPKIPAHYNMNETCRVGTSHSLYMGQVESSESWMDHTGQSSSMGKIIFYEDRDFSGRQLECSSDCADVSCLLSRCNSIRVESGCFMIYEKPNYSGNQYYLRRGEYPDCHHWTGVSDSVRSCRLIRMEPGSFNMRLYERIEFGGQMMDLVDDCPSVMDRFHIHDIFSCNVTDGNWLFYEHPNYRGRMYLIRPGEYKRFSEWGGRSARVGSIRRIMDY